MGSKTVKWCHILTLMQSNLLNPSGFNLGLKLTFKYQASAESLLEKLVLGVIIHVNILIENAKLKKKRQVVICLTLKRLSCSNFLTGEGHVL